MYLSLETAFWCVWLFSSPSIQISVLLSATDSPCYLIKLGLLTDSHFATQQSQFSQLFIRLLQPLFSGHLSALRETITLQDCSTEPKRDLSAPLMLKSSTFAFDCLSAHLFRLYFSAGFFSMREKTTL